MVIGLAILTEARIIIKSIVSFNYNKHLKNLQRIYCKKFLV